MKWKMIKLLLPLLVIVFVVPTILPGPNGRPVMTWKDWLPNAASVQHLHGTLLSAWSRVAGGIEKTTGLDVAPEPAHIYKWKDANGNWHFTDRADKADSSATHERLPATVNSMAPPPPSASSEQTTSTPSQHSFPLPLPTTVPVDKIPQLIDDAKNLQKISDDRAKQLDDL